MSEQQQSQNGDDAPETSNMDTILTEFLDLGHKIEEFREQQGTRLESMELNLNNRPAYDRELAQRVLVKVELLASRADPEPTLKEIQDNLAKLNDRPDKSDEIED